MTTQKRPKSEGKRPPPKCKALLLCDLTIIEVGTNKVSVIGAFNRIFVPTLPGYCEPFKVFMQLAEGIGRYEIAVEIYDLREDRMLAASPVFEIEFPEKLSRFNVSVPFTSLPFEHEGLYDVVVFADRQEIDRQIFFATTLQY